MKALRVMRFGGKPMTEEEIKTMVFRRETRCKKQKHAGVTNNFGVTWCKDCGMLMKNV